MAITWNGDAIVDQVNAAALDGMTEATEVLLAQAVDQTPWVEHLLRNSGVAEAEATPEGVAGVVSFNTPYARRQHEELDWNHPNGGNAKYLERPANAFGDEMQRIIGSHISGVIQ